MMASLKRVLIEKCHICKESLQCLQRVKKSSLGVISDIATFTIVFNSSVLLKF